MVAATRTAKQFLTYVNGAPFQPAIAVGLGLPDDFFAGIAAGLPSAIGQTLEQLNTGAYSIPLVLGIAILVVAVTAFVVVAAPERDALREAAYFVERLETEGMPLAGVVFSWPTPKLP